MSRGIIEDRDTEIDKTLQDALLRRKGRIDESKEDKSDVLLERFLKWDGINVKGIENSSFLKETLLRLERIPPLIPSYPIETHRKSLLGKGIVWFKRLILKFMMRFDTSIKYQNQVNLALNEVIRRLVERIESLEDKVREQQGIIDELKNRLKDVSF